MLEEIRKTVTVTANGKTSAAGPETGTGIGGSGAHQRPKLSMPHI